MKPEFGAALYFVTVPARYLLECSSRNTIVQRTTAKAPLEKKVSYIIGERRKAGRQAEAEAEVEREAGRQADRREVEAKKYRERQRETHRQTEAEGGGTKTETESQSVGHSREARETTQTQAKRGRWSRGWGGSRGCKLANALVTHGALISNTVEPLYLYTWAFRAHEEMNTRQVLWARGTTPSHHHGGVVGQLYQDS
jgi:hypothetical protein